MKEKTYPKITTYMDAKKLSAPYVFIHSFGGLANRLLATQGAILLGEVLNRKVYFMWDPNVHCQVAWEDIFEPSSAFEFSPYLFNNKGLARFISRQVVSRMKKRNPIYKRVMKRIARAIFGLKIRYWYGFDLKINPTNHMKFISNQKINIALLNRKNAIYMKACHNIFRKYYQQDDDIKIKYDFYKPIPLLQKRIDAITQLFKDCTVIGVHIRRTDSKACIKASPTEMFIKAMQYEIANCAGVVFFVASDDPKEIITMQNIFGDRIITQPEITYGRENKAGMQSAVIDLFCLANTNKLIGSARSTFSELAAKMGGIKVHWAE
ncbi:MAG: hypothetical protein HFP78_05730 [Methylococcales symbiont of Hymedesmia sp. n. MRB-2018]|nr:MAG: hypothetical protein HFP78_05730 [Methylococcales symbiont of Hymedesmia sp. n. MRB-2018]